MIKRTLLEYDIKHTGDEMDRLELLDCLLALAKLCPAHEADIHIESVKTDLVAVRIEVVESP